MTLTEMRRILSDRDIQLTKSLGQNFLHDGNQIRRILDAGALTPADKVLEIGPGLGPLTEMLIAEAGEVFAIEKDRRLVEILQPRLAHAKNFTLLHADALDYLQQNPRDWSDWKLVANLPFSVASPLLVELALAPGCPRLLANTLQLEVGRRLMARPGDEDYGVFTLLVTLRYEPGELFKIPASCFHPAPDVESCCITLRRREQPLLPFEQTANFNRLVKMAFSQRRKMMMKLLKAGWPVEQLAAAFAQLGLSPQVRAEAVSLEHFVRLTLLLGAPHARS